MWQFQQVDVEFITEYDRQPHPLQCSWSLHWNLNWLYMHVSLISMPIYWFLTGPLKFCNVRCVWSSCFMYPIQKEIVSSADMCGNGHRCVQRSGLLCSTVLSSGLILRHQQSLHCISEGLMRLFFFYAYQFLEWRFLCVMLADWCSMVLSNNYFLCNLLYSISFLGFLFFFNVWWQTQGLHLDGLHHIWRLQDYNR